MFGHVVKYGNVRVSNIILLFVFLLLVRESKRRISLLLGLLAFHIDVIAEVELMKERFAKLLLGEDMSGGGKGVCTALAISNAITNLSGLYKLLPFFLPLV